MERGCGSRALGAVSTADQSFFAIQAQEAVFTDRLPFPKKHDVKAAVPGARSCCRQVPQAEPQVLIARPHAGIPIRASMLPQEPASVSLTHRETKSHLADELRATCRLHTFFCEYVLENLLVERGIGDHSLEPAILLLELLEAHGLRGAHTAVLLPPSVERRLADAVLAQQLVHRDTRLRLLQDVNDLGFRKARLPHGQVLSRTLRESSSHSWTRKTRPGQGGPVSPRAPSAVPVLRSFVLLAVVVLPVVLVVLVLVPELDIAPAGSSVPPLMAWGCGPRAL